MMIGPKLLYRLGLGDLLGSRVLMLTTTGRVSGLPRKTPLQYEVYNSVYLIGSARGLEADWVKNILKEPSVSVQIGRKTIQATAKVIENPQQVADFLEQRFATHPGFVKILFWLQGYRGDITRDDFIRYAQNRAIVLLQPL
jgi:deazaflavin-dependent oxidoreductase (nitroreductase family)